MTGPNDFRRLPDLAGRLLGGSVAWTNDEFYADVHTLISQGPATHDPRAYGPRGKIYDGWETRRRRDVGEDSVIVRLAVPGIVRGVIIDTAWFRGNFPPLASVEATTVLGYPSAAELLAAHWVPLLDRVVLEGDTANVEAVLAPDLLATHVRLTIHPDGGVARLRVHGEAVPDPRHLGGRIDLAATLHGGSVTGCSNMFFGAPANVLAPGRARVMSDGWETARRRDDGNDWLEVALGAPALIDHVVIDTSRFVGNAPGRAALSDVRTGAVLVAETPLVPDTEHRFRIATGLNRGTANPVESVRLDIFPDGGVSRLRVMGEVAAAAREAIGARWLGLLPAAVAATVDPSEFFT